MARAPEPQPPSSPSSAEPTPASSPEVRIVVVRDDDDDDDGDDDDDESIGLGAMLVVGLAIAMANRKAEPSKADRVTELGGDVDKGGRVRVTLDADGVIKMGRGRWTVEQCRGVAEVAAVAVRSREEVRGVVIDVKLATDEDAARLVAAFQDAKVEADIECDDDQDGRPLSTAVVDGEIVRVIDVEASDG